MERADVEETESEIFSGMGVMWFHRHRWKGSLWNKWYIEVEQRCKCGAYRYHLFEDKNGFDEPRWRNGRHINYHLAK